MYLRKWPHPANFTFADSYRKDAALKLGNTSVRFEVASLAGDVFRLRALSKKWPKNHSQSGLHLPPRARSGAKLEISRDFGLSLKDASGRALLSSPAGMTFGVSGDSSMFVFQREEGDQFYGMGEKLLGLELSGVQSKFWNTDVFADFHWKEVFEGRPDPLYVSVPYLIIKRGNTYVGLLLNNPFPTFINTGAGMQVGGGQMNLGASRQHVILFGAEQGQPDLFILVGPSLAELTRKLQHLVGTTPLPPAWALGYHQCRWGYKSSDELEELDRQFSAHQIPCDGLWVDIDYMVDYKVFTIHPSLFPDPDKTVKKLRRNGRRIIPILDPGVKRQPGYAVYDSGRKAKVFCRNPQGGEFIGLVWPGETAFPDFSDAKARAWWAKQLKQFARGRFQGAWIDMNDPSTGAVQNDAMRFQGGKLEQAAYHNQYGLGMAQATRQGFLEANPGERPFVISRSGFTGQSQHSAIWTGDNCSNYHYLKLSIPCSLNLALSGIPYNGPDIGGFAGDTAPNLIRDWMKACFLFPFCRNHTATGTRQQEPWAFDAETLEVLRAYIRLRYKLRPYLYNLFIRQEDKGEAILRPLFHDFEDTPELPLGRIDDQFLVGPSIMQAPILDEKVRTRSVTFPGSQSWYSVIHGAWLPGHRKASITPGPRETPIYFREGYIVPMAPGTPVDNRFDGAKVEFHVFMQREGLAHSVATYSFDDGISFDYRKQKRTTVEITAKVENGTLRLATKYLHKGFGPGKFTFFVYDAFTAVTLNGKPAALAPAEAELTTNKLPCFLVTSDR